MPSQRQLVRELHRRLSNASSQSSEDPSGILHEAGDAAPLGRDEAVENSNLCLNAGTAAGCSFEAGLDAEDVADGRIEAIAGCLWQIISLHYLQVCLRPNLSGIHGLHLLQGPPPPRSSIEASQPPLSI